jgi:hypothetical protein
MKRYSEMRAKPRREYTVHNFATAGDVMKNAAHHGVSLGVPKDRDVIVARPKAAVTPELAQGIRQHRDVLMRDVLMRQATQYLEEHHVKGANLSVLDEPSDEVEASYPVDEPMERYRAAIRAYVAAGMAEFRRINRGGDVA